MQFFFTCSLSNIASNCMIHAFNKILAFNALSVQKLTKFKNMIQNIDYKQDTDVSSFVSESVDYWVPGSGSGYKIRKKYKWPSMWIKQNCGSGSKWSGSLTLVWTFLFDNNINKIENVHNLSLVNNSPNLVFTLYIIVYIYRKIHKIHSVQYTIHTA